MLHRLLGVRACFMHGADTPDGNLPWPASWQLIEILFDLIEKVDSNITTQLLGEALNMRLGTTGLDLVACADAAAAQNLTFAELMAIPEQARCVPSLARECGMWFGLLTALLACVPLTCEPCLHWRCYARVFVCRMAGFTVMD